MLHINLLPENKRRAEATPIPRMVTILVGLVFFLGLGTLLGWQLVVERPEINKLLKEARTEEESLKIFAAEADALKAQVEVAETRKKAIDDLRSSRKIVWYDILDKISDVVELNPQTWLDELSGEYKESTTAGGAAGRAQLEYQFKGKFSGAGAETTPVLTFRSDLRKMFILTGVFNSIDESPKTTKKTSANTEPGFLVSSEFTLQRERPLAAPAAKPGAPPPPQKK